MNVQNIVKDVSVLIVEDNETNMFVMVSMLKKFSKDIDSAYNGKQGVDKVTLK